MLLFSSSASRDYQFLRELLIRETQKDLARLTIVLQPNNQTAHEHPAGTVAGVSEKRLPRDAVPDDVRPGEGRQQFRRPRTRSTTWRPTT